MDESQKQPNKDFLLPASILVAAFLIAAAVIYSTGSKNVQPTNHQAATEQTNNKDLVDNAVILGDPKAPVTLVEFGDYQCPFCGRFFSTIEPRLREEYIKTGKVKMAFRDFAFLGPESTNSAMATQCAGEQGKYWVYHDKLYQAEIADGQENNGNLNPTFLKSLAAELGLDKSKFDTCLDTQKYKAEVEKSYNDGIAAGVRGTPTTFINGQLVSGAVTYSTLKTLIDQALAVK